MKKIKVLMVTVTFGEGSGVNSFIMNYFRNIDHSKVQIDVLTYKESPSGESPYAKEVRTAGGNVFLLPSIKKPVQHIHAIKKILQTGDYDIVHNNSLLITIPLMIISRTKGIKVRILHSHATKLGESRIKEKRNRVLIPFLLENCNHYIACSDAAGKAMFGQRLYSVLPNVVNNLDYSMSDDHRRLVREEKQVTDKTVIITVGRACEQKNPVFALSVMKAVIKLNPNVVFWWVGDGPMLNQMRSIAGGYGIAENTVFWGKQSNVRQLYEAADIFFLPSLFEGLPVTAVEAQAMGLPSVISDTVTKELVYTDLVEFVPLDAPIDTWIKVIEKQMKRIPARRSYTKELENSVFSIKNAGHRLESLYEKMIEQSNKRRK